jgi:hypothetical protein
MKFHTKTAKIEVIDFDTGSFVGMVSKNKLHKIIQRQNFPTDRLEDATIAVFLGEPYLLMGYVFRNKTNNMEGL